MGRRIARLSGFAAAAILLITLMPVDAGAIIGGTEDEGHPNVGLILALDEDNQVLDACTGTLVAPRVVLSTAHCLAGGPDVRYVVTFRPRPADGISFEELIGGTPSLHPQFQFAGKGGTAAFVDGKQYDVGVLELDRRADEVYEGIPPATLAEMGALDEYRTGTRNRYFTLVGYGVDGAGPNQAGAFIRRMTTAPLMKVTDTVLYTQGVAKDSRGGGGICSGDSGGPVFDADGLLVAVASFVNASCQSADGSTRLDIDVTGDFLDPLVNAPQ
jgi:V8-like Glu-specific endopeptidase